MQYIWLTAQNCLNVNYYSQKMILGMRVKDRSRQTNEDASQKMPSSKEGKSEIGRKLGILSAI